MTTKTGYDRMRDEKMRNPEWAAGYDRARARLLQTEAILQALDEARVARHLTKAELARRIDTPPSVVRRLFSADSSNPTLGRVAEIAGVLGYELTLRPIESASGR